MRSPLMEEDRERHRAGSTTDWCDLIIMAMVTAVLIGTPLIFLLFP